MITSKVRVGNSRDYDKIEPQQENLLIGGCDGKADGLLTHLLSRGSQFLFRNEPDQVAE